MRLAYAFCAAALLLGTAARAVDQKFAAPGPRDALHAVDGKTYWETFALCYASASEASRGYVNGKNPQGLKAMNDLMLVAERRGVFRLITDRGLEEDEAQQVFYIQAKASKPLLGFAALCNAYVKDHDAKLGTPSLQ